MMLLLLNFSAAQDLIINGTVNNTGTIRVKKQSSINQGTVGGEIELKGADQSLQAKQYGSVRLSGSGTKTTIGGSFSVTQNLTIAAPVTLDILKGTIITIGDTLFETGILKGAVQKTVDLNIGTPSSDFGRIGATVSWSGSAPGSTTILRASDSTQFGEGNQSIRRYYDVQVSDATKTGTVTFKYADSELNGHDIGHLQLWRSADNGQHWVRHIPVVDTLLKTLTTSSTVPLKGLWTAADTLRALGPLKGGIGIPASIARANTLDTLPVILTTLDTFKVLIADIYGTPVQGVPVEFAVKSRPTLSAGGILSTILDSTDAFGIARTVFTVGSKVGTYVVTATAPDLDTVKLTATARHGAPNSIAELPVTLQTKPILTVLDSLFTVEVTDVGGNAVSNALVSFTIDSVPSNAAIDQDLSHDTARTDPQGRASTTLTLGTKVGFYGVAAVVTGVNDTVRFFAKATAGAAARLVRGSGNDQTGIVATTVDPFIVTVLDVGDNPVPQEPVKFSISSAPAGPDSGRLSSTVVNTDLLGTAASILTLGTKTGEYTVTAQNTASGGSLSFKVTAEPAAPKSLTAASGEDQLMPILSVLNDNFAAAVTDTFGNAVDSLWVKFTIDSVTANGSGARIQPDSARTDLNGIALARLTLGSKTGLYRVNATVNNVPVLTFTATASAGAAVAMAPTAGLDQKDTILTGLDDLFTVRITDIGGNGVPSKSVQFAITGRPAGDTSAVLTLMNTVTDSLGFISSKLTLGSKVGTYTVKASVIVPSADDEAAVLGTKRKRNTAAAAAVIETTFTAYARNGAASAMLKLLGDLQVNPTETVLDTAFVVAVRDIGDNPVLNDTVRFAVIAAPANAAQQSVDSSVVTDSNGIAKTFLRLGTREGAYTVQASVKNVPVSLFTANAYFIYGDINKDIDINVADITSLVDILNKLIVPSASDSLKADFNRDGLIDTLDIGTIRTSILDRSIFSTAVQPSAFLEEENNAAYIAPVVKVQKRTSASARTVLEATTYGLRVNLYNDEPVRGIELRLHLRDTTIAVNRINMLFKRAEMMEVFVSTKANEVRVVAYNLTNTEITPDSGTIFRLPSIISLDMIDSTEVTIALRSNAAAPVATEQVTAMVYAYPVAFRLSQNYPNPFNGSTTIEYDIPDGNETARTVIQVYNVIGQRVKTLVAEDQQPGRYTIRWDGTDQNGMSVSSGVYFYRFVTKTHAGTRKMVYMK
jgi:hypothetical protein